MEEKAHNYGRKGYARAIARISYEIIERNKGTEELCIVGILSRGVPSAKRIADKLSELENNGSAVRNSGYHSLPGRQDFTALRMKRQCPHCSICTFISVTPVFTYKEDILTGCSAALAGGVTGVLAMPNTKPPCDNPETIRYIIDKAEGTGVDVYPVGCITGGMSGNGLCDYEALKAAGCICISDDGRPVENAENMRKALELSNENGLLVASHCEDLSIINGGIMNKGETSEKLGVKGMDRASEDYITAREMILASSVDARIHICHVSTEGSAAMIRFAKSRGVKVTCETAPHYFMLTDKLLEKRDADYRMNPPLRTPEDVRAIIEAVKDGTIDCIITDHAPHAAEEKAVFEKAPNGVVGLETSLAATLTALYHTGEISLNKVVELMCVKSRKILGLEIPAIQVGKHR